MPRLVNYADRFDAVREAVYVVTLRDGPSGIDMATVARESYMSVRTLQRLVASADHLPRLGLQWADRQWRRRCLTERGRSSAEPEDAWTLLVAELVGCLPDPGAEPDDRRVWWALVTTFEGREDWARTARLQHTLVVESLAASLMTEAGTADTDRPYERERLSALVDGLAQRILRGRVSHGDASALLRRHLADLRTRSIREHDDAA